MKWKHQIFLKDAKIPSGGRATYLINDSWKIKYLCMKNEILILNPEQNNFELI